MANGRDSTFRYQNICATLIACIALAACSEQDPASSTDEQEPSPPQDRPNILLIVADDLGYTDLGVFGSEIETPNLDALARAGVIFNNFYVAPTCSPTRSMLLSGTDHHLAGLGAMAGDAAPNQEGMPGYEGHLSPNVVSLAELLGDGGYHTYMTGKWHLGMTEETSPAARGFEKSFTLLQGGAGHLDTMPLVGPGKARYREDMNIVESLPDDFYSSRFYSRKLIDYIDSSKDDGRPFFAYLAFTAPHWPLQAPDESIAKQKGNYDLGYDDLYARRVAALQETGLVAADIKSHPRLAGEPGWEDLTPEEQRREARMMEIYAAMVDDLDDYVGEVIDYLKSIDEFDNTFIVFMSDNGAEGHHIDQSIPVMGEWAEACCDNSYENMGRKNTYLWYGPNWARASVGPWRLFKGFAAEGGIRSPAFIHYPELTGGRVNGNVQTVMDIMPTILDLAGLEHPGTQYEGREVLPMAGASMMPMLRGETESTHAKDHVFGWELFGKTALRQGDWKIIQLPTKDLWSRHKPLEEAYPWQLYNIADDPGETNDLAAHNPEKLIEMIALWEQYEADYGVIVPDEVMGY